MAINQLLISFLFAFIASAGTFCIDDDFLKKDFSLPRTAFINYKHSDIYRCASSCLMTPLCKSFHLEIDTRLCVLFHRNSSQVELTSKPGVIFSDISHWPQGLKEGCSRQNCPNIRRCVPLRGGSFRCDILDLVDVGQGKKKFFRTITSGRNWQDSSKYCQKQEGQLWLMSTGRELIFFEALLLDADRFKHPFWVGVRLTDTAWRWENGDHVTSDQWAADEPQSDGECAVYKFGFGLYARNCTERERSICEYNGTI